MQNDAEFGDGALKCSYIFQVEMDIILGRTLSERLIYILEMILKTCIVSLDPFWFASGEETHMDFLERLGVNQKGNKIYVARQTAVSITLGLSCGDEILDFDKFLDQAGLVFVETEHLTANQVRNLRTQLRMTVERFAAFVGLPPGTIERWEQEGTSPC